MANFSTRMEEYIAYSGVEDLKALLEEGRYDAVLRGELPFHYLASNIRHKRADLFTEIIELLLDFDFDINARNQDGKTALHVAIFEYQNLPVAIPLMKNGGDFKGVNFDQMDQLEKLGMSLATPMFLRNDSESETMHSGGSARILEIYIDDEKVQETTWEAMAPWRSSETSPFKLVLQLIDGEEIITTGSQLVSGYGNFVGPVKIGDTVYKHWEHGRK